MGNEDHSGANQYYSHSVGIVKRIETTRHRLLRTQSFMKRGKPARRVLHDETPFRRHETGHLPIESLHDARITRNIKKRCKPTKLIRTRWGSCQNAQQCATCEILECTENKDLKPHRHAVPHTNSVANSGQVSHAAS